MIVTLISVPVLVVFMVTVRRPVMQLSRGHQAITQRNRHIFIDGTGMRLLLLHA